MKKLGIIILIITLVALFLILNQNPKQEGLDKEVVRVGVIESLSGNAAYYGILNQRGVKVAERVLNERYPDLDLEIYHQDSLFTPKGGVDAYINLRANNMIDAVITHSSPVSLAVQPLAEEDGILQMAVSASAPAYSSPDDLSFRVSSETDVEAKVMAEYVNNEKHEKVAVIYFQNEIGVSIAESFKNELKIISPEVEIVLSEPFLIETTDFRSLLAKIKQSQATVVYVPALASNMANIFNQAEELRLDAQFLGFRASEDPTLLKNALETSEGLIYTYSFDPNSKDKLVEKFVFRYKKMFNESPDVYAAEGYEATILVVESFVKCGKDYGCIKEYLQNTKNRPSVIGDLTFDEKGNVLNQFFLKTIKNGEFVKLEE